MKLAIITTISIAMATVVGAANAQAVAPEAPVIVTRAAPSLYPAIAPAPEPPRVVRACTQLEMMARIPNNECGQHPLSLVVAEYISATSD